MSQRIVITPTGRLAVELAHDELPVVDAAIAASLGHALAASSAAGLFYLASATLGQELPASLVFWREFACRLFHGLCNLSEETFAQLTTAAPDVLPAPSDAEFADLIDDAPPMRGLEYLTTEALRQHWQELRELVLARVAEFPAGPAAFLRSVNPLWNLLGRVTFHLAENKRDPERPFAFLATYTHRVSARAKLQHLPLGEALKSYAGEKNQERLAALLSPVRRAADGSRVVRELLDSRALFQPQAWKIDEAYRFLTDVPQMEAGGIVVRVPNWWNARRPPRPEVQVRIGQQQASSLDTDSLLDFSAELALDGEVLTDEERQQLLASSTGLVLLRGKWVEVNREQLTQALDHWRQLQAEHAAGVDFIQGMRLLAGASLDAGAASDATAADWSRVVAGDWLQATLEKIRDPSGIVGCQPGRGLQAKLRPYQVEGVRWLWFTTRLGLGACLADDMGLGKTIQVIDLMLQRKREAAAGDLPDNGRSTSKRGPHLLVVPASLVGNWKAEFERFAPSLKVFYAHGSECDALALARVAKRPLNELTGFDAVVTTYSLVRQASWFEQVPWQLVVLDEAQAIKNASSSQTRAVKRLDAAGRIVLTGTPVENQLGDLWSIFDFCSPGLLGSAGQFKKFVNKLSKQQEAHAFGALRRLVRPYILRRLKSDRSIIADLPDKTEMQAECGLSKKQVALYEQTVDELQRRLQDADGIARRGLVLSTLMQLKQICNHPDQYLRENAFDPKQSGKFQRLAQVCEPIAQRQERVLVFTQFQSLTQPLAEYLAGVFGRPGLVLHGGVPVGKRKELVRRFQADDGPPFFVVSVKAGGVGLNLTAASHVVHFDRWWNPAVENQATDRAFRIGQKRNVLVHKFVCRGTLEERIDRMLQDKQQLADEILHDSGEAALTEMGDKELLELVALDLSRATAEE